MVGLYEETADARLAGGEAMRRLKTATNEILMCRGSSLLPVVDCPLGPLAGSAPANHQTIGTTGR